MQSDWVASYFARHLWVSRVLGVQSFPLIMGVQSFHSELPRASMGVQSFLHRASYTELPTQSFLHVALICPDAADAPGTGGVLPKKAWPPATRLSRGPGLLLARSGGSQHHVKKSIEFSRSVCDAGNASFRYLAGVCEHERGAA